MDTLELLLRDEENFIPSQSEQAVKKLAAV